MSERGGRLKYLDALRGLAALCVMIAHLIWPIQPAPLREAIRGVVVVDFDLGRFGVVLFFLLSGFVIPFSLKGDDALRRFAITRFFRLYPAYWLAIGVLLMTDLIVGDPLPAIEMIAANLTMAPKLLGQDTLSGVFWTLFVELLFYGVCATLFAARRLRSPWVVFSIASALAAAPVAAITVNAMTAGHLPVFALGHHLSMLFSGYLVRMAVMGPSREALVLAAVILPLQIAAAPLLKLANEAFGFGSALGELWPYVAAVLLFVAVVARPPSAVPAWMVRMGDWSYSNYLLHGPVAVLMAMLVKPTDVAGSLLYFTLAIAVTLVAAASAYRWIERPMIDTGHEIARQRLRPARAAP